MGTIATAIAALAISTVFNVLALRKTSENLRLAERTFNRSEERYRSDRIEARNDRLRAALVDLSKVINGPLANSLMEYSMANKHHAITLLPQQEEGASPAKIVESLKKVNTIGIEKLSPAMGELQAAISNVLFLAAGIAELNAPLLSIALSHTPDESTGDDEELFDPAYYLARAEAASDEWTKLLQADHDLHVAAKKVFAKSQPDAIVSRVSEPGGENKTDG